MNKDFLRKNWVRFLGLIVTLDVRANSSDWHSNIEDLHDIQYRIEQIKKTKPKIEDRDLFLQISKDQQNEINDMKRDNEIKKLKHEEEIQGSIMTQQKIANDLKEAEKRIEGFEQEVKTLKEEIKNLKDTNGKIEESKKQCKIELDKKKSQCKAELEKIKDHHKAELEEAHKALDELRRENENYSVMLKEMGII